MNKSQKKARVHGNPKRNYLLTTPISDHNQNNHKQKKRW